MAHVQGTMGYEKLISGVLTEFIPSIQGRRERVRVPGKHVFRPPPPGKGGPAKHFHTLISGFHRAFLKSITFIGRLMHLIV